MSDLNPQYLRLYGNYSKAMRDLEKARKRKRNYEAKKAARDFLRPLNSLNRRPVGAPVGYRPPSGAEQRVHPVANIPKTGHRIDMGPIIGIIELRPAPSLRPGPDPTAFFDPNQGEDNYEKMLFENAYANYWHHRKAFFDFMRNQKFLNEVRKEEIKKYFRLAGQEAEYQAQLQLLGAEGDEMKNFKEHIQKACEHMHAIYRNTPKIKEPNPLNPNNPVETDMPESKEVMIQILNCAEKAQLAGLEAGAAKSLYDVINSVGPKLEKYQYQMH